MEIEKIHILYNLAAKRKRSLDDRRHDIRNTSREIARLRTSRDALKTSVVLNGDRSELPYIEQQLAQIERHKTELHGQEAALEAEFKATTMLREACERWLSDRGFEIPANNSEGHTYSYYR